RDAVGRGAADREQRLVPTPAERARPDVEDDEEVARTVGEVVVDEPAARARRRPPIDLAPRVARSDRSEREELPGPADGARAHLPGDRRRPAQWDGADARDLRWEALDPQRGSVDP